MQVFIRQLKPKQNMFIITKIEASSTTSTVLELNTKDILLEYIKSFNMPYKLGKIKDQDLLAIKIG